LLRTSRTLALITTILLLSCSSTMPEDERQNIAVAYAEMLLTRNLFQGDSALAARAVDSTLERYGFDSEMELMGKMKELADDPEGLRAMLDSAQKRLERIQQGLDPDSVKPKSALAPKKER